MEVPSHAAGKAQQAHQGWQAGCQGWRPAQQTGPPWSRRPQARPCAGRCSAPAPCTTLCSCSASSRVGARISARAPARTECARSLHQGCVCVTSGRPQAQAGAALPCTQAEAGACRHCLRAVSFCAPMRHARVQPNQHLSSSGTTNAAVFPEPVRAMPTTSCPDSARGSARRCMGVGSR